MQDKNSVFKTILTSYLSFSLILLTWEFLVFIFDISPLVLVKPSEIYPIMFEDSDIIMREIAYTGLEVLFGWFIGNVLGIIFAVILYRWKKSSNIFISLSVALNAIPLIALSAILGGMIGTSQLGKTVIVVLLCFFPMFITSLRSFTNVQRDQSSLFKTYAASEVEKFSKLIFPSSLPSIFSVLRINVATSIFAAVVGEFFGAHGGIGNLILTERGLYDLPMVWASIFYIIIFGTLFYLTIAVLNKLFVPWRE